MSEQPGDYNGTKRAILTSVFLYVHLHEPVLASVKGQLPCAVIEANFPEAKSTFLADDSPSVLGGYCIPQMIEHKWPLHTSISAAADADLLL